MVPGDGRYASHWGGSTGAAVLVMSARPSPTIWRRENFWVLVVGCLAIALIIMIAVATTAGEERKSSAASETTGTTQVST